MRLNPYASRVRPALAGRQGAISAAHPLAVAAGQEMLLAGGGAMDATIAAQAALSVVAPDACGLGGDAFLLVHDPAGLVTAVNGAGATPRKAKKSATDGGASVTVPGIVSAWEAAAARWGRLPLARCLQPAIRFARSGIAVDAHVLAHVEEHRARLLRGGAADWELLGLKEGALWMQPELALTLERIAKTGRAAFYSGGVAASVVEAVARTGGVLDGEDLAAHATEVRSPIAVDWNGVRVFVQPPVSQGVLLAVVLANLARHAAMPDDLLDHAAVELTEASFRLRDRARDGEKLLFEKLAINLETATRGGGPRAYLHTAGVAASDRYGLVVSSLASVFDDFGSGVFVPEAGFVLNNRGGGFTSAPNNFKAGKLPVHTLAPALALTPEGAVALATPGADGQVQTLLQVLLAWRQRKGDLAEAIDAFRWRSENGKLLVEAGHPRRDELAARGHDIVDLPAGDGRFGAVTCAGFAAGRPFAVSDWRRLTWSGVA